MSHMWMWVRPHIWMWVSQGSQVVLYTATSIRQHVHSNMYTQTCIHQHVYTNMYTPHVHTNMYTANMHTAMCMQQQWQQSVMRDATCHMTYNQLTLVTAVTYVWHDSFVAWLIHICDMSQVIWLTTATVAVHRTTHNLCLAHIHMCDMTPSNLCHDSFMHVTWRLSHVWHEWDDTPPP